MSKPLGEWENYFFFILVLVAIALMHTRMTTRFDSLEAQIEELHR